MRALPWITIALLISWLPTPAASGAGEFEYIGVKKCKICHKKPETGDQFGLWEKSAHAKAYASLASAEAKAEAAKLGIDNPQTAPECLKCHVTAFTVMADTTAKITLEEGVSCESCHGAGSGYQKKATMEGITAGEIDPASVGLVIPDAKTCTVCHTPEGNPFYKEFDFAKASQLIAHPIPEGAAATGSQ
jgi:hypothetical protein